MQTIQLQVEESILEKLSHKGIDIKKNLLLYLYALAESGEKSLSYENARERIEKAILRYKTNPESFSMLDKNFFDKMDNYIENL